MMRSSVVLSDRKTSSGYRAMPAGFWPGHTAIKDEEGQTIDIVRVPVVAEYMAEQLNAGRAVIHPHASIGCRIEVL